MDHLADAPVANILILAGVIFLAVGLFGRVGGFIGSIFGNIEAGNNSRVLAGVLGTFLIVGGGWLHEEGHKPAASNPPPTAPAASTPSASTAALAPSTPPAGTNPSAAKPDAPRALTSTSNKQTPSNEPSPAEVARGTALAAERETVPASPPPLAGDNRLIGTWTNLTPRTDSISRIEVVRVGRDLDSHLWYSCSSGECDHGIHKLGVQGNASAYEYTTSNRRRVGSLSLHAPGVLLLAVEISEPGTQRLWHQNWVLVKSTASDKVQGAFSRYLAKTGHKAFAMAPGGMWSYQFKAASDAAASQSALKQCQQHGAPGCRILLVNNDAAE